MNPPIPGMTVTPMGLPLMGPAWASLLQWAIREPAIRARFKKETGHDLLSLASAHPINRMIDQATGRERAMILAFADWVSVNYWGVEKRTSAEQDIKAMEFGGAEFETLDPTANPEEKP